jgi:lipopolysaccharide transport system permease protein
LYINSFGAGSAGYDGHFKRARFNQIPFDMASDLDQLAAEKIKNPGLIGRWREDITSNFRYQYLLSNLVRRDLKVRYRNSFFGVLWSLLNPLLMMLVFSLVFAKLIPREDIRQYAVFFLVGLLPWQFFTGSLMSGSSSITGSTQLVKKVHFPRILLPTASTISNLVNFLIAFLVLLVFLFVSGIGLTIHSLWVAPLLLTQILFILGLVLLFSSMNVFYRDVIMILNVALLAMFFLTPIIYPLDWLGDTATILGITFNPAVVIRWINPMASIIDGYRTVLWGTMESSGPAPMDPIYLIRTFVTSALIFAVGFVLFRRTQHVFGEKL